MSPLDGYLDDAALLAGVRTRRQPEHPALIPARRDKAMVFGSIAALAAKVQAMRGEQGLRLADCHATWPGFDTFPAVGLYVIDDTGQETWLATAAIQGRTREVLEAAIRAAEEGVS